MRRNFASLLFSASLGANSFCVIALSTGCAMQSSTRPIEYLDERTAATVGALKEPIELVPGAASGASHAVGKRISFAYLGPVEWDNAGRYGYGLWVHVAAGTDWAAADIRSPSALTLMLDDGAVTLVPMDAPQLGRPAYEPIASWGQTSYFELSVKMLRRMAASRKLALDVAGADGKTLTFAPSGDTRAALDAFLRARAITGD